MSILTTLPLYAWLVVLVAFLITIGMISFLLCKLKPKIKIGDKSLNFGQAIDAKLSENRAKEHKEQQLKEFLHRESDLIDLHGIADMKRVINRLDDDIADIFELYMKCVFPAREVCEIIRRELRLRIDENNLRVKFSTTEKDGYMQDILYNIERKYNRYLKRLETVNCQETYPEWDVIKDDIQGLVEHWTEECSKILISRMKEKISLYREYEHKFELVEYKESGITKPIQKNMRYIQKIAIGGIAA